MGSPRIDVGLYLQLWLQFLRHALLGPSPETEQIGLRDRHRFRLEVDAGNGVGVDEGIDVGRTEAQLASDADRQQPTVPYLVVDEVLRDAEVGATGPGPSSACRWAGR